MKNINKSPPMGQICLYTNCEVLATQTFLNEIKGNCSYYCHFHSKVIDEKTLYVIEMFGLPSFVLNENGEPITFETYPDALQESMDCQDGYILNFETMEITK